MAGAGRRQGASERRRVSAGGRRAGVGARLGRCGETQRRQRQPTMIPAQPRVRRRLQPAHALARRPCSPCSPCVAYPLYPLSVIASNPYPRPQGQPRPSACPPAPTPFPLALPSTLAPSLLRPLVHRPRAPPSHPPPTTHSPSTVAPLLHRSTCPSACPASAFPFRSRCRTRLSRTGKSRSSCDQPIHRDRWTNRPTLDLRTY